MCNFDLLLKTNFFYVKKDYENSTKKKSLLLVLKFFIKDILSYFSPTAGHIGMNELYFKSEQQISAK
jgi:hypothetical protein